MPQSQSPKKSEASSLGSTKQFILALGGVVLLIAGGAYFYFNYTDRGVSVNINLPEKQINAGDIFEVDVIVSNQSQEDLKKAQVTLSLPGNIKLLEHKDRVNDVRGLDDISVGRSVRETYILVALPGGGNGDYTLEAMVNYVTDTFSSQFERRQSERVDVKVDDFALEITLPGSVVTGEGFAMEAKYKLPSGEGESLDKFLVLEGESLSAIDSSDELVADNKWLLETGDDKNIQATLLVGSKGTDVFVLTGKIIVELGGEEFTILERKSELLLAGSSLALFVVLDDPKGFANPGELLGWRVSYKNNMGIELQNAIIKAQLIGDMFDFDSLETSGTFDSLTRTITWSSSRFNELKTLSQGEEGTFTAAIKVRPSFPIDSVNDKDFTLEVRADIESPTVPQGANVDRTSSFASSKIKVAGALGVETQAYFRDAASGILNQGPFPPKVGMPTEYTVHWSLVNFGTDVEDVVVRARLEGGVSFTNDVKSNVEASPQFDASTGEVVWSVGNLKATTGVIDEGPEATFQISLTPGLDLLGEFAPLLGIASISGKDIFTGVGLSSTDESITTELPDDPTVGPEQGRVIQ
ncbi:MAG: hypothetical protein Q8P99_01385 [bacterium]|nr:hypothetical protein [bacterium]